MIVLKNCIGPSGLMAFAVLLVSLVGDRGSAHAGMIISVEHVTMAPGSSATFNVKLRSTAPDLALEVFVIGYTLTIDNSANPGSLLEFAPGLDAATVAGHPNYIFSSIATNAPSLDIPLDRSSAMFSDLDNDFVFSIPVDTEVVIGTFTVSGIAGADPVAGDSFEIQLSDVIIVDNGFEPFDGDLTIINGNVAVTTAVVPEPSSLAILALMGGVMTWSCRRRRLAAC